jgi:hypothetical protein
METNKETEKVVDVKIKISTLWIVIMFNMAFIDILGLYIPGGLEEMAEFAGGMPIPQLMLIASVLVEISIVMIFLSRVLKYKANRWANIIAGIITIIWVVGGGSTWPHYLFMGSIEVICSLLIIWYTWKWPNPEG